MFDPFAMRSRRPAARRAASTACAACGLAAALACGPAGAADLVSVLSDAVANDPVFASARFALEASGEAEPQARAALRPNVALSASVNETRARQTLDGLGSSTESFFTWGPALQVSMPLYRAQLYDALNQSKATVRQSQMQYAQARQDLIVRVAQAYFDELASSDALVAIQTNKQAISEQLAQAQREFEVGTKTIVDTHEAKARFDLAVAQEQVALGDLVVKKSALRAIVGRDEGELAPLADAPGLTGPQPSDVEAWARQAEQGNFTVQAAQAASDYARQQTQRARDAYRPTVDLTGTLQWQRATNVIPQYAGSSIGANTSSGTVGLVATVPLYTGDLLQSRIREARAGEHRAEQDLEAARRNAAQAARQAYTGTDYGLAQVRALESAEVSAKSQLDSTRLGYQVGFRINLDVLNANTQLFNTQRDLKKARYDVLLNGLRLKAAAGGLDDKDVQAVNTLLKR